MNGNNLLTFWKGDKRVDPETGGVGSYPIVRTYTLGLRVSLNHFLGNVYPISMFFNRIYE
jgi:hypothetical protein